MAKILVIDDERAIRSALRDILEYEQYHVDDAEDGKKALKMAQETEYDVILCDIKMQQMDGLEVLEQLQSFSQTPVIMISGHGTIDTAVESIKKGAFDYIEKPLDLNRLLITLRNALDKSRLVEETKNLRKKISKQYEMIGSSPALEDIRKMIDVVAPTDARILIYGANGVGKELVARQLHERSQRSAFPFIEVNCAAIPSELIESQLFGHEKGSFTSAIKQRKGDFELADGGTLFLDEIGDMSLSAQAKVLRALQENRIIRVGGEKDITVNVRVIAATNKNLKEEIEKKTFREDLYHRLSVIIINMPSLSERLEDIPELVHHFSKEICKTQGKPIPVFDDEAIKRLQQWKWTGNIRELRNVVERLIILCPEKIGGDEVKKYL